MSTAGRLYAWRGENLRLAEALEAFAAETRDERVPVALLYQPAACLLARLEEAGWHDAHGEPVALDSVFEARCFCPHGELRFVHDAQGHGRAVYLSETEPGGDLRDCLRTNVNLDFTDVVDGTYLLWGRATDDSPRAGWTRLFTQRIGPLDVPVTLARESACQLVTREYVDYDKHGNARIIEERLVELQGTSQCP